MQASSGDQHPIWAGADTARSPITEFMGLWPAVDSSGRAGPPQGGIDTSATRRSPRPRAAGDAATAVGFPARSAPGPIAGPSKRCQAARWPDQVAIVATGSGTGGAAGTVDMGRLQGLDGCPTITPHSYHCRVSCAGSVTSGWCSAATITNNTSNRNKHHCCSRSGTTKFSMTECQPFCGQAVHADTCFGCIRCQGTMGLRGNAEGEDTAESSCG